MPCEPRLRGASGFTTKWLGCSLLERQSYPTSETPPYGACESYRSRSPSYQTFHACLYSQTSSIIRRTIERVVKIHKLHLLLIDLRKPPATRTIPSDGRILLCGRVCAAPTASGRSSCVGSIRPGRGSQRTTCRRPHSRASACHPCGPSPAYKRSLLPRHTPFACSHTSTSFSAVPEMNLIEQMLKNSVQQGRSE